MRTALAYALGLVAAAALVNDAQGRRGESAEVCRVGVPAALAVWAGSYCYGRVVARRIADDARRTVALSSRPEHTRERVLAVFKR